MEWTRNLSGANSATDLSLRLEEELKNFEPGRELPSIDSLAEVATVEPVEAEKAYRLLELKGLVVNTDGEYRVSQPRTQGRYEARGVSASKNEVHAAVDKMDGGLFPKAFCKVTEDLLGGDPHMCSVIHADGSGTKSIPAYLMYRETKDPSWFHGIAQDSIVMNLDDLLCVGAVKGILFSNTVNRNSINCPGEVVAALISGTESFLSKMRSMGVELHSGGGETADVGDLVRTITVDSCAVVRMKREEVLGKGIDSDMAIVGLSSSGKATYEDKENSGIGSNGLTSARHELLCKEYAERYPECVDPLMDPALAYCGPYRLDSPLPESSMTVGEALLSPTRTYAPVVAKLLESYRNQIGAMIHCSGGAQTKCLRFGNGVQVVKDNLFETPPVFKAIQEASGTPWKEMFRVFNMGHRMEVYCKRNIVDEVIKISESFGISARQVGVTEKSDDGGNHVKLIHGANEFHYGLN